MKKTKYLKPEFYVSRFTPNEFCAACDTHYLFNCNAGKHGIFRDDYDLYYDNNNNKKWDSGDELISRSYHPCGYPNKTGKNYLEVPKNELRPGIIKRSLFIDVIVIEEIPVFIYNGPNGKDDVHATPRNTIETTRS